MNQGRPIPVASRPYMPGYRLLPPERGRGLLGWSWAEERLERNKNYWLATTWPDGRPHAMAVWGVWMDARLYFSTGSESRKAKNLAHDPRCVVTTDQADEPVILEGDAERVTDAAVLGRLVPRYAAKYGEAYPEDSLVFAVRPDVVFGLIENAKEFAGAATRWRFSPATRR
jgi:hypothetical protein